MNRHSHCPVCSGTSFSLVREPYYYRGKREDFSLESCDSCGFWFTNPFPEGPELAAYYETEDYVSHTDGKGGLMDWIYGLVRDRAIKSKYKLVRNLKVGAKLFVDYGAGTGAFLAFVKSKGHDVLGFEPSEVARKNAEQKGLNLLDPENRGTLMEGSVSVFTLWHVLEHIPDLNETLRYFNSRLESKGYLIIAVPNHESADAVHYGNHWAAYDVPLHLWHFAKSDVKSLAVKHGFKVQEIHNMPFDSFYVSLLSEKNKTGKMRLFSAFLQGWKSNRLGKKGKNMSSLIYVLQKKA